MGGMRESSGKILLIGISLSLVAGGVIYSIKKGTRHPLAPYTRDLSSEKKEHDHHEDSHATHSAGSDENERPQVAVKVKFPIRDSHSEGSNHCKSVEFRGEGFQGSRVTAEDWQKVTRLFQNSQKLLKDWLKHHHEGLSEKGIAFLEAQLESIELERPPILEEPDLNWRGIGVYSRNSKNLPVIRIPVGFVKLVLQSQKRAQFEMTRLVAQSWAPCELQAAGIENPWESVLKCLEVQEPQACAAGTYSEGGWAVSSLLASVLSPPGCELPAFSSSRKAGCHQK